MIITKYGWVSYSNIFRLKTNVLADCIVRAMVCYIAIESSPLYNINYFGENKGTSPTSFSHIHALQLAQQGTVTERKLGKLHIDESI